MQNSLNFFADDFPLDICETKPHFSIAVRMSDCRSWFQVRLLQFPDVIPKLDLSARKKKIINTLLYWYDY